MRSRLGIVGVGMVVSVLAAAAVAWPLTGAAAAASSPPPVAKQVTLTFASAGATALGTKGELVIVKLSGHGLHWSATQAIQSTPVLRLLSERATTTGGSVTVFQVVNYGAAGLDATGTSVCRVATGCPPFVLLWHASVVAPVVDPPPPVTGRTAGNG